jgi:hypothetical protein
MIALAFICLSAPLLAHDSHGKRYRWDLFQFEDVTASSFTIAAGGFNVAAAEFTQQQFVGGDSSTITLTGNGTFRLNDGDDVTGGGTWTTAAADGTVTGTGTYRVTKLVLFELGTGSLAGTPGAVDDIANLADTRAGIALLKVHYSDGENGVLTVSCNIAGPASVIEGSTATKGVVDYADPFFPTNTTIPNAYGNTIFHIIHEDED